MTTPAANRRIPTASQVLARQKADAERELAQKKAAAAPKPMASTAVGPAKSTAAAVPDDSRDPVDQYLDAVAPATIAGRLLKFSREGKFITNDDKEPVDESATFIVLADQTLVGWVRFHDDAPPERVMGELFGGFKMPPREELGSMDESEWAAGLDGEPADPWQHHQYVILQHTDTAELFTYAASSKTGRRAVGNLLKHYRRMRTTRPDELPVVKLKAGGFPHKDDRVGWVPTPVFAVVGRAPRDSTAKPDTSLAGDLNDEIPFL